ncbi:hypothetical protein [Nonomuraea gerenzanensis]|uniref:hypothetical protein n=1 Tax=Nonomuraea gerenzanensis TaxID=93944 RepID=UPI001CD9C6B1|nr:hypothetical protein [Nonomuraea gerenzanensis]UBU16655.1 hypothetical protein LCN96_17045 [Nonomuraea gerenzanensis]
MSTAVIAAIAGILGIIIGRLWDTRSESTRWRRDQKVASYQRFAEQFQSVYEGIRSVALADPGTDNFQKAVEEARRDRAWDCALTAVWLHGSPAVVAAANSLDKSITKLFYDAQERVFLVEDWHRERLHSQDAFIQFVNAVREELALAPVDFNPFPQAST